MDIAHMTQFIKAFINKEYRKFLEDESIDLIRILSICDLYKSNTREDHSYSKSDDKFDTIIISSPDLHREEVYSSLQSKEFKNRYRFFIKILYSFFKIGAEIFDMDDGILILKNNRDTIKSLIALKKALISKHITILTQKYKNPNSKIDDEYNTFLTEFCSKSQIIDLLISRINSIISANVISANDSILSLILPYFYADSDFIEVYGD
jgi:hypothetical protein